MTVTGIVVGWRIKAGPVTNGKGVRHLSSVASRVRVESTASPNWNSGNISGTIAARIRPGGGLHEANTPLPTVRAIHAKKLKNTSKNQGS
ncbi:MAG: hypothetical protein AB7I68_09655 [Porticoccaceae bacterium]